jgi:hypothetical protein
MDSGARLRRSRFVKVKPTALAGALAASVLVLAPLTHADPARQLLLRGPQKLTAGPLLGFVAGSEPNSAVRLARIDPATLRPSGTRSLRLPFADAWAVAPGGTTLAVAVHPDPVNEPNFLKLGKVLCCTAQLRAVVADVHLRRVVQRQPIAGTVLHIARWAHGLVLLTAPTDAIGPASLVVAGVRGVRSIRLGSMLAGEIPGDGGVSTWRLPGLAVDAAGRNAYVIDPDGSVAEIKLATLEVSFHGLARRSSLLTRLDAWLEPAASAKGDSGPVRRAQWIGNGFVLVTGSNLRDTEEQLASDPAGLELIDTRNWTVRVLAPGADSFTVANGVLLVTGARWHGNTNPTGMGLEAFGPNGKRRFGLFRGHDVWVDHVAKGRAYVAGYGWKRERVVDLRSGRVTGTRKTETPMLLLGQGSALG